MGALYSNDWISLLDEYFGFGINFGYESVNGNMADFFIASSNVPNWHGFEPIGSLSIFPTQGENNSSSRNGEDTVCELIKITITIGGW